MRKSLSWAVNITALLIFIAGCRYFFDSRQAYDEALRYLSRAAYTAECGSAAESSGCAGLYAVEPSWPYGVEITDKDVLLSAASVFMDSGAGSLAISSVLVGISSVLLAGSVIVHGQARARRDAEEARAAVDTEAETEH